MGAAIWFGIAVRLGREYIQTLRESLAGELGGMRRSWRFEGDQVQKMLVSALDSPAPSKVLLALKLLSGSTVEAGHLDESVELSGVYSTAPWLKKVEPLVEHENLQVAAAALNVLVTRGPSRYIDILEERCG
ncbi:MAG: hypothetical protein GWN58_50055, partial [Anaerolineae bacterium]|nr:hypothetical protein [Anaerolineae bacterium]